MSRWSVIFIRPFTPAHADTHNYTRQYATQHEPPLATAIDNSTQQIQESCQITPRYTARKLLTLLLTYGILLV